MSAVNRNPITHISWRNLSERLAAYAGLCAVGFSAVFAAALSLDQREMIKRHIHQESSQIPWIVFLTPDRSDKGLVEEAIRSFPGLFSLRFVSKEEALENVQKDETLAKSLTLTGHNPFPDAFEVRWEPYYLRKDYLDHVAKKLSVVQGIDHIGYDPSRVERFSLMQGILSQLNLVLTGLLWASAVIFVLLVGKLLFFPKGRFPREDLALALALGSVSGVLGAAASDPFVSAFSWPALSAGPAVCLLLALLRGSFDS